TRAQGNFMGKADFEDLLGQLRKAVACSDDEEIRRLLWRAIPTYLPDPKLEFPPEKKFTENQKSVMGV
ncbi:MAG: hypothetical protein KY468_16660, partial [Armatimonadetes bacterium]|nr:hypothetical protein [Armatimonadota bacterium]